MNFVTCHDGFTLEDLVSYNGKHNEANGEGGADGSDDNRSWNCGAEGPTSDPAISRLRARQKRNFLATLFCAQGVPMLLAGDEIGRTQHGNNNAYCQDNEVSWVDWAEARTPICSTSCARLPGFGVTTRYSGGGVSSWAGRLPVTGSGDIAWLTPSGRYMTDRDWGARLQQGNNGIPER